MNSAGISKIIQVDVGDYNHWLIKKGLSPNTCRGNLGRVQRFKDFLSKRNLEGEEHNVDITDSVILNEVMSSIVNDFVSELQADYSPSPATINAYVTAISQLCQFCSIEAPDVLRLDYEPEQAKPLTREEFHCYLSRVSQESVRDQAIAWVLATTGVKLGQLRTLNVEDVQPSNSTLSIMIRRKRRTARIVALGANATKHLALWLDQRPQSDPDEQALFVGRFGRLSDSAIDQIVRRIGLRAGLVVSCEILRRTSMLLSAENILT